MQKQHQSPEFQVICQDEANAKFFVASGQFDNNSGDQASSYEEGTGIGDGTDW